MFCSIRGKNPESGITRLQVPSSWPTQNDPTNDEWADSKTWDKDKKPFREVTLPDGLEYYLVQRNRRHFGQAEGTCFTVPPPPPLCLHQLASGHKHRRTPAPRPLRCRFPR
jgi:hypothetical protein